MVSSGAAFKILTFLTQICSPFTSVIPKDMASYLQFNFVPTLPPEVLKASGFPSELGAHAGCTSNTDVSERDRRGCSVPGLLDLASRAKARPPVLVPPPAGHLAGN